MGEGLDPRRAVQVISNCAGRPRLGSGYQVSAKLVLTAEHVVTGAQALTIRFVDGPGHEREVPGWVVWAHASAGLAVVRIGVPTVSLSPAQFGRLRGPVACEAVGYPWFKLRDDHVTSDDVDPGVYRESHHVRGVISPHSNRRSGTLEMSRSCPLGALGPPPFSLGGDVRGGGVR